jgi:tripartite-type tricarboxylate transporter receptor subunit TctC
MPQDIVNRLHDEIVRVLNSPQLRARGEDIGFPIATSTPAELNATIRRDLEYTGRIVKAIGIKPE